MGRGYFNIGSRYRIRKVLSKVNRKAEYIADNVAHIASRPWFLFLHLVWWAIWIGLEIEDAPYGELTMVLSMEAIVLSIMILNSSTRAADEDRRRMTQEYHLTQDTNIVVDRLWDELQDVKTLIRNDEFEEEA